MDLTVFHSTAKIDLVCRAWIVHAAQALEPHAITHDLLQLQIPLQHAFFIKGCLSDLVVVVKVPSLCDLLDELHVGRRVVEFIYVGQNLADREAYSCIPGRVRTLHILEA